ncbi:PBP1 and LysM peptidoglycan-binding domain-containing protein [Bacteroides ihuae]|uniref:PBP1 and LysM peptidoglycan-binding domain-containing protein n=1 Tax=Bacteroides ihuae TaxID=1852362 RepID=UPI0008D958C4|nr:LysM peptidoglycan-binding domain-containing protein [Bacteroides ihuae]
MKFISKITILLFVLNFCFSVVSAQENSSYFLHTIEKGQSLYSISSMYGVSKAEIITLNPGCEEKIYIGQALKIPQNKSVQKEDIFHTIKSGETLYRLSVIYKVSADAICDANPGLSSQIFQTGTVIRIPLGTISQTNKEKENTSPTKSVALPTVKSKCRDMHKAERKETIYSISRDYGISEEELINANPELRKKELKKGHFLCIPYPAQKNASLQNKVSITPSDNDLFSANKRKSHKRITTIKAAVILPFMLDENQNSESSRMIEYYEGFLLAMDSLKRTGTSIDLYTYDSKDGSKSINSILAKSEMRDMDIIFGPLHQEHIDPLASFAKKNNIRLVIPFTSKDTEVFQNPAIYQINTPQSYLYSEVYDHFVRQFSNANVIILETGSSDQDKTDFIKGLKQELKNKSISVHVLRTATSTTLKDALIAGKENLFIPTSGSNLTLIKLIPQLKMLVKENPEVSIHLFGYPEWQTYTKDHLNDFFELDTYFYSSFYTNNLLPAAIKFTNSYRRWYSKEMANTYPKYGMLGFDTGFFFLKGLADYGSGLEQNLSKIKPTPIQTGFKFERVNTWGGFINKKVFFVRFTKNFELVKLDFE